MQKLLFLDIDGTIYSHSLNTIPTSTKEAIIKAHDNGHLIFISTGRCYPTIEPELFKLPINGIIASCGAHIILNDEVVSLSTFNKDDLFTLIKEMEDKEVGYSLDTAYTSFANDKTLNIFKSRFNKGSNLLLDTMVPISEIKDEDYDKILKVCIFDKSLETVKNIVNNLPSSLSGFATEDKILHGGYSETMIKGISKATGINIILNILNKDIKDTIAIGDSLNDIEMISEANIGIAMGNACEELKDIANYITDDIDDDGLAKAFEHFNLI